MPIKQVVCSICKETVNKAQTYHVGGENRACKKHEGVLDTKAKLDAQKQKAQSMSVQKAEHGRPEAGGFGTGHWSGDLTPKCWVCMNTGMRSQEFFMRYLIECEKQSKLTGKTVIPGFDKSVRMNTRCIFVLAKEKCLTAMKYVREEFQTLIQMAGFVAICGDCCRVAGIDPMPKVEWEDIKKGMVISELVVRPIIEKQASMEITRDN